jgi:hypothetical protein
MIRRATIFPCAAVFLAAWTCLLLGSCSSQVGDTLSSGPEVDDEGAMTRPAEDPVEDCGELIERVSSELGGLSVELDRGAMRWQLTYRPAELVACSKLGEDGMIPGGGNEADLFVLSVRSTERSTDALQALERMRASLADAGEAISVEKIGAREVACGFVHFEPGAGIMPEFTALLGFDHAQDGADRTVIVRDTERSLGGDLVFKFPEGHFARYTSWTSAPRS